MHQHQRHGDMHTKMFTFTSTTDPNGVRRPTSRGSGRRTSPTPPAPTQFNNTITVYGDTALIERPERGTSPTCGTAALLRQRLLRLRLRARATTRPPPRDGVRLARRARPDRHGRSRLNDLTPNAAAGADRDGLVTSGRPWSRLSSLPGQRCNVWMAVIGSSGGKIDMTEASTTTCSPPGSASGGSQHPQQVLPRRTAGSAALPVPRLHRIAELDPGALNKNEEIFVKMGPETGSRHPLYDAYHTHFNETWRIGSVSRAATLPLTSAPPRGVAATTGDGVHPG